MIVIGILLNGLIVKQQINHNQINERVDDLETNTKGKITELAVSVINTKQDFSQQISSVSEEISYLKAETKDDFSDIIEDSINSVVTIRTLYSQGTGFAITNDGYIVTNAHVIANDEGNLANLIQAITNNKEIHDVEFVGSIGEWDLALLKIQGDFDPMNLGNSNNLELGEKVIAIGNPQGFQFSVTDGIISALHRTGTNGFDAYIQTNTELNPGNSGGPLINKEGEVIGMNNFKLIDSEGLGFALESNYIKNGINEISNELLNQTLI